MAARLLHDQKVMGSNPAGSYETNPTTTKKLATHTPIVLPQSQCTIEFLDNSLISDPALELHSRAAPSVGGITAQLVQPQGEIRRRAEQKKKSENLDKSLIVHHQLVVKEAGCEKYIWKRWK